ncbi:hypothetical protein HDC37_003052 [Microbacterium sp. AK009]|uniref:hypothetical protein n=1 Tax=Microbacterium sp. AK009 TaxID=2723068 RepID=UPI0015CE0267|nr:hypothetical protein [Microbacterium sp. AK009]NYF18196.1 hypothetical protein [Microbacterium sp. AK009]
MTENLKIYEPTDLVLFVWPRQSELEIRAGGARSRQEAASNAWAMDRTKAERVSVIVSVFDDRIIGAWAVAEAHPTTATPEGKTRKVTRVRFDTYVDPRLSYLVGQTSQLKRRRNPQSTIQLRDLDGSDVLFEEPTGERQHGVARLGEFTLTVREDGSADLVYPATAAVTLRPLG